MTIRRSIFLGIALLVGAAGPAGASDLYGGSMKDGPYGMPEFARWYLRGDVGYATHRDSDISETDVTGSYELQNTSIDEAWTVGGGVGIYFTTSIRGDITYDRRMDTGVEGYKGAGILLDGDRSFDVDSNVVLANLYYDIDMGSRFTPYLGFGLGWASNRANEGEGDGCECGNTIPVVIESETTSNFAWALMAGFVIDLGGHQMGSIKDGYSGRDVNSFWNAFKLDFGYRYLDLGEVQTGEVIGVSSTNPPPVTDGATFDDYTAHEFRVGLRYDIY